VPSELGAEEGLALRRRVDDLAVFVYEDRSAVGRGASQEVGQLL